MIGANMKMKKKNLDAFTLIELIVSMSIIVILTAIFLANYHSINKRTDLTITAQSLVSDIRYAQSNSLGLLKYQGSVPAGGWGVAFSSLPADGTSGPNKSRYEIFADENNNAKFDLGEADVNLGGRVINLPANIVIDNLSLESVSNVTFLPPDPITKITGASDATSTYLTIILKDTALGATKTVRVNFLGLIEVTN